MALQAGQPALDWEFDVQTAERREQYFSALRQGFKMNFNPLEGLVRAALDRARRSKEDQTGVP